MRLAKAQEVDHRKPQRPSGPTKQPPRHPPSKGRPPWKKPKYPPKGSEEENETGGGSTKGQGGGGWKPPKRPSKRPPRPKWPPQRPPKKWPKPPSKGPGRGHCAARMRKKKGCGDYEGMWYNNGEFYTCSRVRRGGCPTLGSFFATCEECMEACHPRKIKQCQFMN
ncbi:proline-rich protein HaeIII subfamily 1 [Rhipicephalus sanguineus]|uniref:proline-rich protein HaeIII subfamily 1 n=1 Tax=Rhipicephalus sanguineus TaxID=34632 RepID=UPI00189629A0|nr:proline-rich protein HaeIII subfamily 1 [Rhipicephalus sanguineus]XP_037503019.1 proline-rich protein HaeIII subfamily 1 [Rhipicephalus sanguineus]